MLGRPPVVVGAIVIAAAALGAVFAVRVTSFEPDELGYTRLALGIAHSLTPFTLSYGGGSRLNQLYPLLIAPVWGLFGNITAFRLTHAWNAVLMSSAAIPAYLLTREVVRARWAAYLATALVAVLPWLALSTGELTEVAAYPASVWALLAMQRSLALPSTRRDIIALIAIAVAAFGRLQLILFAPVFVVAMVVHELGYGLTEPGSWRAGLRAGAVRMARRHTLLSVVSVIGIFGGVPLLLSGELASAAGFYGDTLTGASFGGPTFDLARSYFTAIALGIGAIPAALAIGFGLSTIVAPVSRRVHAYASLLGVVVVALVLQVAEISVRFTGAVLQERYLFYIAPLLVVGMFAALLETRRPPWTMAAGSLVLGLIVATTRYAIDPTAFWYQVSPGLTSFYGWVLQAFGAGPAPSSSTLRPTGIVVAAAGILLALLLLRVRPGRVLAALAAIAIVFCGWETTHALVDAVNGTASGAGLGGGSLRTASWVDDHVPAGATVNQMIDDIGGLAIASQTWNNNAFWNRTISGAYAVQSVALTTYLPTTPLTVAPASGAMRLPYGVQPAAPLYLVVSSRGFPVAPVGAVAARRPSVGLELIRAARPLRTAYFLSGVSAGGWLAIDEPAILRLYSLGKAGQCANVALELSLSAQVPIAESVALSTGGETRRAAFAPGQTTTLNERVCAGGPGVPRLSVTASEPLSTADQFVTPRLVDLTVSPR